MNPLQADFVAAFRTHYTGGQIPEPKERARKMRGYWKANKTYLVFVIVVALYIGLIELLRAIGQD